MKIKLEELKKAIDRMSKESGNTEIHVSIDRSTLLLSDGAHFDEGVKIKIYESEMSIFPKITKTDRL